MALLRTGGMNIEDSVSLTSNESFFPCKDDSVGYKNIHDSLLIIGSSVLLVFGTGGNLVTYNIFRQSAYRGNVMASMFRYLSALDLILLWTMVLQLLIKGISGYHIITSPLSRGCIFVVYFGQVILSLANWLLVDITLARLVNLKCPLKSQTICSKLNYKLLLFVTHIFVIGVHGGDMLIIHSRLTEADYNSGISCVYFIARKDVNTQTQKLIYMTVNFIGPTLLLIIFNTMIVLELRVVQKRRQRLFSQTPTSSRRLTDHTTGGRSESATARDQTHNALWSDDDGKVSHKEFGSPNYRAYDETMYEARHGEETVQEHLKRGNHKGQLTSQLLGTHLDAQSLILSVNEKTSRCGHGLARQEHTDANPTLVETRFKQRPSDDVSQTACNIFGEIGAVQDVTQRADLSNVILSKENSILRDLNWNRSEVLAPPTHSSSVDPPAAKDNSSIHIFVGDASQYLGAALAVGSEVTSQSSRDLAAPSGKRLSIRTWISDLRSQGVDMECKEDRKPDLNAIERMKRVREGSVAAFKRAKKKQYSRTFTLTLMLITASALFLILNTPFWLFHLGAVTNFTDNPWTGCNLRYMMGELVVLLRYANSSVNCIFYCAIGSRFRQDFFVWFRNLCP